MRRSVVGGLALAFLATSALAAPGAQIALKPGADGLTAVFTLSEPVEKFVFDEAAPEVRADTWHAPAGMSLKDGVLKRDDGKAFSTFTVTLTPDTAVRDRSYPALTRIGDGWQVYGPYFTAEKAAASSATVTTPRGWLTLPRKVAGKAPLAGYLYMGPATYVSSGAATLVTAPNVAKGLRAQIVKAGQGATAYYTRRLGPGPTNKPTLITTRVPGAEEGWQGDVVDGPAMSLRFYGKDSSTETDGRVASFVAHEAFHFWNRGPFNSREPVKQAWLHEGAAEYGALLAARETGALSEREVGDALAGRLTDCAVALGDKGMADKPPKSGKAVYDCGVAIQWAADLKLRAASGGKHDVLDAWREVFAYAKAGDGGYDAKGFLAAAGMKATPDDPLTLLMQPAEGDRWTRLTTAFKSLGANLETGRSDAVDRRALLIAVLSSACDNYGFNISETSVQLRMRNSCDLVKGDPSVDAIAGKSLRTDASGAYDAALALCAAGSGEVPMSFEGKVVATLPCRRPLPAPPKAWTVTKWR